MSEDLGNSNPPLDELNAEVRSHNGVDPLLTLDAQPEVQPKAEPRVIPVTTPEIGEIPGLEPLEPSGPYTNARVQEDGSIKRGRTFDIGDDGKPKVINRKDYNEKYGPASASNETKPDQSGQEDSAVEKATDAEKKKAMVEDWARHEYNGDKEGAKKAQDAVQEYLIDAVKRGVMTDDEAVAQIDNFWLLKEANKAERHQLLEDLGSRLRGRLDELSGGGQTDNQESGEIPKVEPLTEDEVEARILNETIKLPENLKGMLDSARRRYIEVSAKRRGVNSGRHNRDLEDAKREYFRLRDAAGAKVAKQMEAAEFSKESIQKWAKRGALLELHGQANGIRDERIKSFEGRKFKGFYEWWGRQSGGEGIWSKIKGRMGKRAVSGVVAFGAGLGISRAVSPAILAGAAVGGVVGGVRRHLDRVSLIKEESTKQAEEAITTGTDRINRSFNPMSTESLTYVTDQQTKEIVGENRKQLAKSVAIGAAAGAAGAAAGMLAENIFDGGDGGGSENADGSADSTPGDTTSPGPDSTGGNGAETGGDNITPDGGIINNLNPNTTQGAEDLTPSGDTINNLAPGSSSPELNLPDGYESNMPWTNAAEVFNSPDPNALIQQTLDTYNDRFDHNFEWRDGRFWEGDLQINPEQLREYNRIMAELAGSNAETLPLAS